MVEVVKKDLEIVFYQIAELFSAQETIQRKENVTLKHAQTGQNGRTGDLAPNPVVEELELSSENVFLLVD